MTVRQLIDGRARYLLAAATWLAPLAAAAEPITSTNSQPWYQVIAGIAGLPAVVTGIVVSWNMMRKSRLENRKLELEITEKEKALTGPTTTAEKLELIAAPLGNTQRALLIVVRYIVLELVLMILGAIGDALGMMVRFAIFGLLWFLTGGNVSGETVKTVSIGLAGTQQVLDVVFSALHWIILIGFGWPLFKDACALLRIPVKSLLDLPWIASGGRARSEEGASTP